MFKPVSSERRLASNYNKNSTSEQSTPIFRYNFAPQAQKDDTGQAAQASGAVFDPLKRSSFDVIQNANFENTSKTRFDGSFSQSFSSRHAETHAPGSSAYLRHTPEIIDSKPPISTTVCRFLALLSIFVHCRMTLITQGTSSRLKNEPIGLYMRVHTNVHT